MFADADSDGAKVTSDVTSANLHQTDDVTSPPATDQTVVNKPDDDTKEAESDALLSSTDADKDVADSSARASHTERSAARLTVMTKYWTI